MAWCMPPFEQSETKPGKVVEEPGQHATKGHSVHAISTCFVELTSVGKPVRPIQSNWQDASQPAGQPASQPTSQPTDQETKKRSTKPRQSKSMRPPRPPGFPARGSWRPAAPAGPGESKRYDSSRAQKFGFEDFPDSDHVKFLPLNGRGLFCPGGFPPKG